MPTGFEYFLGPAADMAGVTKEAVRCWYCRRVGIGLRLDGATCRDLASDVRAGKFGCFACLREGRFEFWHDTDIGLLGEDGLDQYYSDHRPAPDGFPAEALVQLRRTPQFVTWQQARWLTHCRDFMAYLGTWQPADFVAHAPDGDGRALFHAMTRADQERSVWDDCREGGADVPSRWPVTYYAFRCRSCGALAGYYDFA